MGQTCSDPHKDIALPDFTQEAGWQQREYLRAHDVRVGTYGADSKPSGTPYQAYLSHQPPGQYESSTTHSNIASTPATLAGSKLSSQLARQHSPFCGTGFATDFALQQDKYLQAHNTNLIGDEITHNRIVDWSAQTMKNWRTDPFYEWRDNPQMPRNRNIARKDWCWQNPNRKDDDHRLKVVSRIPEGASNESYEQPEVKDSKNSIDNENRKKAQRAPEMLLTASWMRDPTRELRKVGPEGLPDPLVNPTEMRTVYHTDEPIQKTYEGHKERLLAGPPQCFQRR